MSSIQDQAKKEWVMHKTLKHEIQQLSLKNDILDELVTKVVGAIDQISQELDEFDLNEDHPIDESLHILLLKTYKSELLQQQFNIQQQQTDVLKQSKELLIIALIVQDRYEDLVKDYKEQLIRMGEQLTNSLSLFNIK